MPDERRFEIGIADARSRLDEVEHDVAVGPRRLVIGDAGDERLLAVGAGRAGADHLIGRADRTVRRIVEAGNEPALAASDGGSRFALDLAEIVALLVPNNQIAAPVGRLGMARHFGYEAKTLGSRPAGKLHQIAHMHILIAVIEIPFSPWQRIG